MRRVLFLGATLWLAHLLAGPALHAQYVPDGTTNTIDATLVTTGAAVDIGTSADNTLLVITNGGRARNTGIAYIGHNAGSEFNRVFVNGAGSWWNNLSDLYIGFEGANNQLHIQAGAKVTNNTGVLGGNVAGATNNLVVVDGAGSVWDNKNDLELGLLGGGNTVLVTNGGRVVVRSALAFDGTYLGHFAGAGNNQLIVSGTNSAFSNLFTLHHGYGGGGNLIRVTEGGRLDTEVVYVGEFATASGNAIEVTGNGSLLRNSFEFVVGSNSAGNTLLISGGGRVQNTTGTLGGSGTASNNSALVTGAGSTWSNRNRLFVGLEGRGNQLTVSNGGTVTALGGVTLGATGSSTDNRLVVDGGSLIVRNAGSAVLDVLRGTNRFAAGLIDADRLLVTNALSRFEFTGGTLITRGAFLSNGLPLIMSGATAPALWDLRSGSGAAVLADLLLVGTAGNGNGVLITNGQHFQMRPGFGIAALGVGPASTSNFIVVNGSGSRWSNLWHLTVGSNSVNNRVEISGGGYMTNRDVSIGQAPVGGSAAGNEVLVRGANSTFISSTLLLGNGPGGGNRLLVTNGALLVTAGTGNVRVGANALSGGNDVTVTGGGSQWSNRGSLFLGDTGASNRLLIADGARVTAVSSVSGVSASSSNNVIVVTGALTEWTNNGALTIGSAGGGNVLLVSNQAVVYGAGLSVGASSAGNTATVTGTGSAIGMTGSGGLTVGTTGASNRFTVADGAAVNAEFVRLGQNTAATANEVVVTGTGATLLSRTDIEVGRSGGGSRLLVGPDAFVTASNAVTLGGEATSLGNRLEVNGGTLTVTNLAGTGLLDVRRGTNVFNGGLVDVDRLFVTNALGKFEFLKGLLRSRYTEISNGLSFVVGGGNGPDIAFADLEGTAHRFADGLEIRSNATVRARSDTPILSPAGLHIRMGGTLLYQLGNQLAAATPLTLSGGTLDLGGNTQTPVLGALTHSADSTIDFGTGGTQTLQFNSLASHTPGTLLFVQNWTGIPSYGGGTDQLIFTGGAGVTAGFLSELRFVGFPDGGQLLGTGEIVPTPEPATWLSLAALGGTLLWRRRAGRR